jgi:hypothetical protein
MQFTDKQGFLNDPMYNWLPFSLLARENPDAAAMWLGKLPSGSGRRIGVHHVAEEWARIDIAEAFKYASDESTEVCDRIPMLSAILNVAKERSPGVAEACERQLLKSGVMIQPMFSGKQ